MVYVSYNLSLYLKAGAKIEKKVIIAKSVRKMTNHRTIYAIASIAETLAMHHTPIEGHVAT